MRKRESGGNIFSNNRKRRLLFGFTPSKIGNKSDLSSYNDHLDKEHPYFKRTVFRRFSTGFTLIEVAVTSSILIFLMATVWSSGAIRASDFSVMISQEKLRLLATRAKSMTVNSVYTSASVTCGYGVRIEQRRAFVFLDEGACGSGNNRQYDSGEEVTGSANSIALTEGIVFLPSTGETAEVVFIPPYSETVINGDSGVSEVDVEVRAPSGMKRRVIINNQGLINMKN